MNTLPPGNYCPKCGEVLQPVAFCADVLGCALCKETHHRPPIDYTESGAQYMIPDAPTRKVPDTPLRAKRVQTEKPTLLEMYEEETKQPKLF